MMIDFAALVKSKTVWANLIGLIVAVAAVFGVAPDMTGKTAEYATMGLAILNLVLRMFGSDPIIEKK
jgi:hypothetical protein